MKKTCLKYFVFLLLLFCFGMINCYATRCEYEGAIPNSKKGEKIVWLSFNLETDYKIVLGSSPLFGTRTYTDKNGYAATWGFDLLSINRATDEEEYDLPVTFEGDTSLSPNDLEIYLSNVLIDQFDAKSCPPSIAIFYYSCPQSGNFEEDNVAIVPDDDTGYADGKKFTKTSNPKQVLSLVSHPDDTSQPEVIEDKYNCITFSFYVKEITPPDGRAYETTNQCDNNPAFDKYYNNLLDACARLRSTAGYNNNSSNSCLKACSDVRDLVEDICYDGDSTTQNCGPLGNGFLRYLFKIIKIIRYVLPVILIILSILDFIKSIADDDDNKTKEATKKFIRRLIAIVLLFVIPFILDFLFNLFKIPGFNINNPYCAKKG